MRLLPRPPSTGAWMVTRRGTLRAAASCAACILAGQVPAAETDYPALVDAAGRQRMLTQRVVKAYCQIGLDVTPEASTQQLRSAVRRFDTQLAELGRRVPVASAHRLLEQIDAQWRPFRRVAIGAVTPVGAQWLAGRSEGLLAATQALVGVLQAAAGSPQARLVDIAGRQRMLSQRLATLYMLRAWHVDVSRLDETQAEAAQEFGGALATLLNATDNTPDIAEALDHIALQWQWLQAALAVQGETSHALLVAQASETILTDLERVVGMYARMAVH